MSISKIFTDVENFIKGEEVAVDADLVKIFGPTEAKTIESFAVSVCKDGLGKIALEAVTEAEKLATDVEKHSAAAAAIIAGAQTLGLVPPATGAVNWLIETALQVLNGTEKL